MACAAGELRGVSESFHGRSNDTTKLLWKLRSTSPKRITVLFTVWGANANCYRRWLQRWIGTAKWDATNNTTKLADTSTIWALGRIPYVAYLS